MTFQDLVESFQCYDQAENRGPFLGHGISEVRVSVTLEVLGFLRGTQTLLAEPFLDCVGLAAVDNCTKGMWLVRRLWFCMTQYYKDQNPFSDTLLLPNESVSAMLQRCVTTIDEVVSLISSARSLEVGEMLKLGELAFVIDRS